MILSGCDDVGGSNFVSVLLGPLCQARASPSPKRRHGVLFNHRLLLRKDAHCFAWKRRLRKIFTDVTEREHPPRFTRV